MADDRTPQAGPVDTCLWCNRPEAEHKPESPVVVGDGVGRLCPVPGATSQYWTSRREWSAMVGRKSAEAEARLAALLAENESLREALTWAVGYLRCNMPSAADYPDFRHAAALVADGKQIITGEFTLARFRAEQAEEEAAALRADVGRLRAALHDIATNYDHEECYHRNEMAHLCRMCIAEEALAATVRHAPE